MKKIISKEFRGYTEKRLETSAVDKKPNGMK
jgi:hypothetical protein